jgi:hypothetical protein
MKKLFARVPGLVLTTALIAAFTTVASRTQEVPVAASVPIGGILMWWGAYDDIPEGYEACDGRNPTTKDALFRDRKPDLQNRFAKGADDMRTFVPQAFKSGGSSRVDFKVDPHELTLEEVPGHTHSLLEHVHPLDRHDHAVDPRPLPLAAHTHTIGDVVEVVPATSDGVSVISASGTDSTTGSTPLTVDVPSLTTAKNTDGVVAKASTTKDTGRAGGEKPQFKAKPHGHTLSSSTSDMRPPFLDVLYIIRVK